MLRSLALIFFALTLSAQWQATIVRDRWGVPHIYGKTDADVFFGVMYAQAEDNFWQLEDDTLRALGRASELYGTASLVDDLRIRAYEVLPRAQAEYARMSAQNRVLCDAYAAGVNRYLATHSDVHPRLLARWEPWFLLAIQNAGHTALSDARNLKLTLSEIEAAMPGAGPLSSPAAPSSGGEDLFDEEGSNMWALSPSRTRDHHTLLLINPHVYFFGGGQRYEAHLESKQGLSVSGFAILGTPYLRAGFTSHHGWSHTNNLAKVSDSWTLTPEEFRNATTWTEEIRVKTPTGTGTRHVTMRKTTRGPVVAIRDGKGIVIAVPLLEKGGTLEQRLAMAKARTLDEFKAAMAQLSLLGSNTLYADSKGNIYYLHGNAIPKRRPDGEWDGYHAFAELPQVTNPKSGYLQNCNSTPELAAGEATLEIKQLPKYMATEPDNFRAQRSRQILERKEPFTYETWRAAAPDTTPLASRTQIPELLRELESKPDLAGLAAELKSWDGESRADSVAASLFVLASKPKLSPESLARVKQELEAGFGTWRVPWGELSRLQRVHTSGSEEDFSDARPSLTVTGCPGTLGCLFAFNGRKPKEGKRYYGVSGNSYVAVVEFGRRVRAESIVTLGQSADPKSPHYFDQAPLYAAKQFKPAWFTKSDVKKNAERTYTVR